MKVTKFGHCCLLIEEQGVKILTDPGSFTTQQDSLTGIDIVLITHEHQDHFHVDSVKKIMANNPQAVIVSNSAVGKLLDAEGMKCQVIAENQNGTIKNVLLEGFGHKHAVIYGDMGQVENTGYMINGKLFYPGDAFTNPGKPVESLALPVAGPWMKISEAIDYVKELKPKKAFPVHDAVLNPAMLPFFAMMFGNFLQGDGIEFIDTAKNNIFEL